MSMGASQKKNRLLDYDGWLLFPVLFLVGIGIVMVYSASSALALKKYGSDIYFLKRQSLFALVGIGGLVAGRHIPFNLYRLTAYPLLALALGLLAAVHVGDWGVTAGGSTRWLRLGAFTFQPSEMARFALVSYLAYSLSKKGQRVKTFSIGFVPHAVVLGLMAVLIFLQPDFGSVVILAAITWIMMFVAGVRLWHLTAILLLLLPLAFYALIHAEYRILRLMSFLDPWQYPADAGYQIVHALMAFGSGGLWGSGIGQGYQKLFYLPEPHTDFVFAVIGEELGLVGVMIILCLFGLILGRGIVIAQQADNAFGAFLAAGITTAICLGVCINMGVNLSLLPTKGLTLPFLSYGGTSLVINMASVGILMNIGAQRGIRRTKVKDG